MRVFVGRLRVLMPRVAMFVSSLSVFLRLIFLAKLVMMGRLMMVVSGSVMMGGGLMMVLDSRVLW
jgi:hypothetical protein